MDLIALPLESLPRPLSRNEVRVRTLDRWESVSDLEAEWGTLLDRCPDASVFQTLAWHQCWWKAFGGRREPWVILAYIGSRLVGIAPMMVALEKGALGGERRRLHFIGSLNHASDYCDFIVDPDHPQALDALLEALRARSQAFDRIDLSHFPGHSPNWARTVEVLGGSGAPAIDEIQSEAPTRILGDRDADLKAANKSSLKRHTNFFRKAGDLRFHRCASEAEILGYLERFFEQHKERWASTDSPSQFGDPAQRAFYRELVSKLFREGWLRFDAVLFDGAPLAFNFGFEYRRRFIWYKPTFDARFAARSPGEVLIKFLLEDAIGRKLEEFDFTVGSEAFKFRFANRTRTVNRLLVFRSATDYWTYRAMKSAKSMVKKIRRKVSPGSD